MLTQTTLWSLPLLPIAYVQCTTRAMWINMRMGVNVFMFYCYGNVDKAEPMKNAQRKVENLRV